MPRHNSDSNVLFDGYCTSSCPSSSFSKTHCLKRKVLISKKKASTTPVPSWRDHARSSQCVSGSRESPKHLPSTNGGKQTRVPLSARKLANALWTLSNTSQGKFKDLQGMGSMPRCVADGSFHHHICNQQNSSASELLNQSRSSNHQKYGSKKNSRTETSLQGLTSIGGKKHSYELHSNLVTAKKLMKMLIRLCGLHKQPDSAISLARIIYCQLSQALVSVDQLVHEKESEESKFLHLLNQIVEEKGTWKKREGIRRSFQPIIEGLETERKLRRRAECKNEKLRVELEKVNSLLVKACDKLESERKTREMIEQFCGRMIKEIGDDKAEVEDLKRESVKAREELDKERQMLQLADELREERIQMKLSEAKYQYEEKNAAVDQLRCQLEAFLVTKRTKETENEPWNLICDMENDRPRQMVDQSKSSSLGKLIVDNKDLDEENDETDSEDSDLHLIELNLDNNNNGYCWNHASAAIDDDKLDFSKEKHCRSTKCEKLPGTYLSSEKVTTDGVQENFTKSDQHLDNNLDEGRQIDSIGMVDLYGERCTPEQVPKEQHTEDDSRIVLPLSLPNSTRQSSRQQDLQSTLEQVCLASKVSEMLKAFRESESKANLGRMKKVHSELQLTIQ